VERPVLTQSRSGRQGCPDGSAQRPVWCLMIQGVVLSSVLAQPAD
jgi:hypothetical protein